MELTKQIKKHRTARGMSQEELAEKLYVSRQTISNWETGKNYPDIHSLLLMSSLFDVSLDQLMKGDLEEMKEEIKMEDIKTFNWYSRLFSLFLILTMLSIVPLVYYLDWYGAAAALLLLIITFVFARKVEQYKKEHDIQTYKEIVAFMNGKRLDEITKHREFGKRPYQKILIVLACGAITFIVSILMLKLMSII